LYKQPGLLGASQSSALKQWTSTALNLVGGGLAKGLIKKLAVGATTLPMQVSASQEENYAEVGDNYVTRLKNMLKSEGEYEKFIKEASDKLDTTDEDEIFTQFKLGNFVPTSKKQLEITARAAYGLGALYQTDMMATTYDDVFTTALELTPLGHLSKATRTGRIAQSMMSGSMVGPSGMLFKPVLDYASSKIAKTSVGQALKKRVAGLVKFAEEMPEKMLGKYNIFGKSSIPHRVLGQKGYMRYAALKGAGKDLGGRVFRSSLSEGIEEGKQYLNAQKYISGEFDDREYMGLLNVNRMLDDAEGFAKSAVVMAGFPLFLSFTNDKELIANIKGGMKGGFMQTGATMTAQSVIPTIQQVRQTDRLFEMY
jgi:hypothetical protein